MAQRTSRSALDAGLRALRARDHSAASLDARLERLGAGASERAAAIARLQEIGYVDDARFAHGRAAALAARGAGDTLIAADLERQGIGRDLAADAIAALEPEWERAARIVAQRGATPRTLRFLAAKGFSGEALEQLLDGLVADATGGALG